MRTGPVVSLILSIIVGVLAVVFGRSWINREADAALPPEAAVAVQAVPTVPVLVANQLIERGMVVTDDLFDVAEWPETHLPDDVVVDMSMLDGPDGARPFSLGIIAPGEPLLAQKLSRNMPRETLAGVITPGYRAVAIQVDDATGVAGFVLPDHRVDVILSREFLASNGTSEFRAEPVVEDVRVLAVDQNFDETLEGAALARTVTVEVTSRQAQSVSAAADNGRLSLSLRAKEDITLEEPKPAPRPVTPRRQKTTTTVRVISGEQEAAVTTPIARKD
ncbi:MAG: Flp pilus assembly protein CpaB [Pseudomonadota bacterium]